MRKLIFIFIITFFSSELLIAQNEEWMFFGYWVYSDIPNTCKKKADFGVVVLRKNKNYTKNISLVKQRLKSEYKGFIYSEYHLFTAAKGGVYKIYEIHSECGTKNEKWTGYRIIAGNPSDIDREINNHVKNTTSIKSTQTYITGFLGDYINGISKEVRSWHGISMNGIGSTTNSTSSFITNQSINPSFSSTPSNNSNNNKYQRALRESEYSKEKKNEKVQEAIAQNSTSRSKDNQSINSNSSSTPSNYSNNNQYTVRDFINRGDSYIQNKQPEKALEAYNQAVALAPNDSNLRRHVNQLETKYNSEQEYRRQLQQQQQAQIEKQRIDRERRLQQLQAEREQLQVNMENMARATTQATQQAIQGNYAQAGHTVGMEYARQGDVGGAIGATAVGIAAQIINDNKEAKRRREEAERRRREAAERKRLEEERQRRLLEKQKREFNAVANEARQVQREIVAAREKFLKQETNYTKTYDLFSKDGSPIYFFLVTSPKDYNYYQENIAFPDKIDIEIKEQTVLKFSPMITVYPNSSGEFPFLKDLIEKVKLKFTKKDTKEIVKVFNWTRTKEDIENLYALKGEQAIKANFQLKYPSEVYANLNDYSKSDLNYWISNGSLPVVKNESVEQKLDYWGVSESVEIPAEIEDSKETIKTTKAKKIDYWTVRQKTAKDSVKVNKTSKQNN